MKRAISAIILLAASFLAHAETYMTMGLGRSSEESAVVIVGAGTDYDGWIKLEFDYRDFGSSGSESYGGAFVNPYDQTMCNPQSSTNSSTCYFNHKIGSTRMRGVGLSALFTADDLPLGTSGFLRIGAMPYAGTYREIQTYSPRSSSSSVSGVTGLIGIGISKGSFSLEISEYSSFYPTAQGTTGLTVTSLSYKLPF